jgi:putative N6-adenine-specific DNA methylase
MCGSGTLAIEAAQWALAIAPGLTRARLGCERWLSHDDAQRQQLHELREQARSQARAPALAPPIFARDSDEHALAQAKRNAARAGVALAFARADVRRLEREHERAFVVMNPPYGERLARGAAFERELAQALRKLRGYRVCALVRDRGLPQALRIKPVLEHTLWNGPLQCRLFCWEID